MLLLLFHQKPSSCGMDEESAISETGLHGSMALNFNDHFVYHINVTFGLFLASFM